MPSGRCCLPFAQCRLPGSVSRVLDVCGCISGSRMSCNPCWMGLLIHNHICPIIVGGRRPSSFCECLLQPYPIIGRGGPAHPPLATARSNLNPQLVGKGERVTPMWLLVSTPTHHGCVGQVHCLCACSFKPYSIIGGNGTRMAPL